MKMKDSKRCKRKGNGKGIALLMSLYSGIACLYFHQFLSSSLSLTAVCLSLFEEQFWKNKRKMQKNKIMRIEKKRRIK